jgi:S1-C subfamily serine protease
MKTIFATLIGLSFTLLTFGQCLNSEQAFKEYYKQNISTLDPIEGIWSISTSAKQYDRNNQFINSAKVSHVSNVAVIKKDDYYFTCNSDGSALSLDTKFYKTAISGIYLCNLYFKESYSTAKADAVLTENGLLEFKYELPDKELKRFFGNRDMPGIRLIFEDNWIKMFPTENEYKSSTPSSPSSGTGFAISSDGMIVTNHHVVNGATNVNVRGINGDFSKTFKAKIVSEDKNNDLAVIQIDDISFSSLGTVPYVMQKKSSEVGTSIYCLGYPLRATMGDEVKLTNGIISSKSGYQGDITTYQITAPVQPGNSGGPLFDDKGNIVGIINAKHLGAENASYAVKVAYLLNLIDVLPNAPKLQTLNTLEGKSLPEQVKIIKNFVYIIEINF